LFDDKHASFFGVSIDPADEANKRVVGRVPGYRLFWDFDGNASRLCGVIPQDADPTNGRVSVRRIWVVLDPTLGYQMERFLVGCYRAEGSGHFAPHRDNTTKGTAHRLVFSCSLLHSVSKVTRGQRYAFLPFIYDEEASRVREANNSFLGDGVEVYKKN
jgi:hypothetical protein